MEIRLFCQSCHLTRAESRFFINSVWVGETGRQRVPEFICEKKEADIESTGPRIASTNTISVGRSGLTVLDDLSTGGGTQVSSFQEQKPK